MDPWSVTVALVSAVAALASAWYARTANRTAEAIRADAKELYELHPKREALRRYLGCLHYATGEMNEHPQRADLVAALNGAVAAFGDDKEVANALRVLKAEKRADDYLAVIKAMSVAAKLPLDEFDDAFLTTPFSN